MMVTRTLAIACFALVATCTWAADTPHDMYMESLARERTVRAALVADDVPAAAVGGVRAVVTAYQAIVKLYPASGYSDNALWHAGRLSLDVFLRFGQPQDKTAGLRLLRSLAANYPTSKLVKQVPHQLARVEPERAGGSQDTPLQAFPQAAFASRRAGNGLQTVPGPQAGPNAKLATIKEIRRTVLTDAVRVTIEFDNEVSFHDERIPNPLRVFVDLPSTLAAPALLDRTLRFDDDRDVVRQIRLGRHPNNTTRVVLDAAGVASYSVYPLYDPYRLVIDCVREPEPPTAPPEIQSRKLLSEWARGLPAPSPRASALIADALTSAAPPPIEDAPPRAAEALEALPAPASADPPLKNLAGGYSIARQLGLGVARIVIDPGHGGRDPGAQGKSLDEAELVLDLALRVEKLLQKVAGMEVILTRRTDEFVPLQERTAIANREGADLFLSIHANASQNQSARGVETYFLNFASNMAAASVAARENAASGQPMGALPDFVRAIALNNKLAESRDFATEVQRAMVERLRGSNKTLKDLGVKQAPFVVLIGASMPSALVEISFVTNAREAKLLRGNAYRQRIADALFNAIRKYQTSLKAVATVAHK